MSAASSAAATATLALNTVLNSREGSDPIFDLSTVCECIRVNPELQVCIAVCSLLYMMIALRYLYKLMFKKTGS